MLRDELDTQQAKAQDHYRPHLSAIANAYSATTVLPAEVWAATSTECPAQRTNSFRPQCPQFLLAQHTSKLSTPCSQPARTCLQAVDRCLLKGVQGELVLLGGRSRPLRRRQLVPLLSRRPGNLVRACLAVHLDNVDAGWPGRYPLVMQPRLLRRPAIQLANALIAAHCGGCNCVAGKRKRVLTELGRRQPCSRMTDLTLLQCH